MKLWKHPSNYIGATWEGWLVFLGRNRDSDCLVNSNFDTALSRVRAVMSKDSVPGEDDCATVQVVSENHWLCGWVEWVAIHPSDTAAVAEAEAIESELENYPVLDEEDFSRREDEEAQTVWRNCYNARERVAYMREHASQFDWRDFADLRAQVRGEYFTGYASELIS